MMRARFGASCKEALNTNDRRHEQSAAKSGDLTLVTCSSSLDPTLPSIEPPDGLSNVGTTRTETLKPKPNWLRWSIVRKTNAFRVFVVEPREYSPAKHGEIFNAALTSLVTPRSYLTPSAPKSAQGVFDHFDLITFPEAFLPTDELLSALDQLSYLPSFGCVHVGLRPAETDNQHLLSTDELRLLVDSLIRIPKILKEDLNNFSVWLGSQLPEGRFNVGCLFTIDAQHHIRVCLHPKLVRSRFEISALHESHMTEADLLSLVTLQPEDSTFLSIVIHPLICSDALFLDTDRPNFRPLEAVASHADCFGPTPPDHIDIVSVVTCTPQPEHEIPGMGLCRQWHQEFRNSFLRTTSEMTRHHFATFILSNFSTFQGKSGGLSGAFLPNPMYCHDYPPFVSVSAWGSSSRESDNSWSPPVQNPPPEKEWSSLGYVATLAPADDSNEAPARMLGFTIHRLLRHITRWSDKAKGFTDFQLRSAILDSGSGKLEFRE